jgi:hypothetical protein
MAILAISVVVLYFISTPKVDSIGSSHYDAPMTLHSINKNVLVKTTFGNLGTQGYACTSGNFASKANLNCTYGVIFFFFSLSFTEDKEIFSYEVIKSLLIERGVECGVIVFTKCLW